MSARIVVFGGGTGMSGLLSGLKHLSDEVTAVVAVTDNGGSSGRLRKEFDMVPPGDIRNCLVSLTEEESILARLLQYRFEESELRGHSFGNLFITALTRVTGSFDSAVRELNQLLEVRGRVLPATGRKVSLIATHPDGSKSTGEIQVSNSEKPISKVEMRPRVGLAEPDVLLAIEQADLLVFGPGSLFTSVIPNLLVPGIAEAVIANSCDKVYVANIMTQPGETNGLDLAGHLQAIEDHAAIEGDNQAGQEFITGVILHDGPLPESLVKRYAEEGATRVEGVHSLKRRQPLRVGSGDLLDSESKSARHHSARLARCLMDTFLPEK